MIRKIALLTGVLLALSYGTYFLFRVVPPSVGWYIFGAHLSLILGTALLAVVGAVQRSRFCIFALIVILPLVYAQFFS